MFNFVLDKNAWAVAALSGTLACSAPLPASAFSLFGANSPIQHTTGPMDRGGNVFDYYGKARSASGAQRTVIAGVCASACTMKLGIRNACVEPNATLLFHQANYNGSRSELATRIMLYAYPQRIRQWVLRTGALNSSALTALSGREAIAMGVHAC